MPKIIFRLNGNGVHPIPVFAKGISDQVTEAKFHPALTSKANCLTIKQRQHLMILLHYCHHISFPPARIVKRENVLNFHQSNNMMKHTTG